VLLVVLKNREKGIRFSHLLPKKKADRRNLLRMKPVATTLRHRIQMADSHEQSSFIGRVPIASGELIVSGLSTVDEEPAEVAIAPVIVYLSIVAFFPNVNVASL
jgi:hypothetical protein